MVFPHIFRLKKAPPKSQTQYFTNFCSKKTTDLILMILDNTMRLLVLFAFLLWQDGDMIEGVCKTSLHSY